MSRTLTIGLTLAALLVLGLSGLMAVIPFFPYLFGLTWNMGRRPRTSQPPASSRP